MSTKIERRSIVATELRAEGQGDEMSLVGYAALFNVNSKDLGGFKERIATGAFSRSLKSGDDCVALFNHDPNKVLGRRSAGTLKVNEDAKGLRFVCSLDPNNSEHKNLHSSVLRGDVCACSFAFTVPQNGDVWDQAEENGVPYARRTLRDVNLLDVSAVTYPAYEQTSVAARSEYQAPAAFDENAWRAGVLQRASNSIADSDRRSKALATIAEIFKPTPAETRDGGNQDWFSARAQEACSALDLDYCDHDNDFIYAADLADESEVDCYRFAYQCGDDGAPQIDKSSRVAVKHDLQHSERGLSIIAQKRQRAADFELEKRMRSLSGISVR